METPISLVVYAYDDEEKAAHVLKTLKELQKRRVFTVLNAAVLVMDMDGRAKLRETEDIEAGRGALFGAIAGGLIGLLGGPAGAAVGAVAGAATGAVTAHQMDMGFFDEYLSEIQESLRPGSSALIALVEHEWVEQVIEELERFEGAVFRQAIKADIAAQLGAGGEEE